MNIPKKALTKREAEIVRLITAGKTNSEIADRLDISVKTVEAHKHSIFLKADHLKQYKLKKQFKAKTKKRKPKR